MRRTSSRGQQHTPFVAVALAISAFIFLLFLVNVLLGKYSASLGWLGDLRLSRVSEFLLLLSSVAFFVIASLGAERSTRATPTSAASPVKHQ